MYKVLVLEDDSRRIFKFRQRFLEAGFVPTFVDTAKDCITYLEKEKFDCIFLDHDFGGEIYVDLNDSNTGSAVARWMNCNDNLNSDTMVIIHSFNPAGAKYMNRLIKNSFIVPAVWENDIFEKTIKFNKEDK